MGTTREAALKRWERPGEHERMSRTMRSRYRPKIRVGVPPQRSLPAPVSTLLDTLGEEAIEVTNCEPVRVRKRRYYSVTLIDGATTAITERYHGFVQACGLDLYRIFRRPLPNGDGLSIVLTVGIPKGAL